MQQRASPKENYLVLVLSISAVLGVGVALAVYFGWIYGVIPPGFDHALTVFALIVCPPFILSVAASVSDSGLAVVLVAGTIVFANAALYAGVAAGGYFVVSVMVKRKRG